MSELIIKCPHCGDDIKVDSNTKLVKCRSCRKEFPIDIQQYEADPKLQRLIDEAIDKRNKFEFDEAITILEDLLSTNANNAEIYFQLLLSDYGVSYVSEDNNSIKEIPVISGVQRMSIFEKDYYKKLESILKDNQATFKSYKSRLEEIDKLRLETLEMMEKVEPFEVFICYKRTDNGLYTKDSETGKRLYQKFTSWGLKVFFAEETIYHEYGGQVFEPIIYSALMSAKLFVMVCASPDRKDYLIAPWVKNEWMRFKKRVEIEKDNNLALLPVFDNGFTPEMLPKALGSKFQGIKMDDEFDQNILKILNRVLPKENKSKFDKLIVETKVEGLNIIKETINIRKLTSFQEKELSNLEQAEFVLAVADMKLNTLNKYKSAYTRLAHITETNPHNFEANLAKLKCHFRIPYESSFADKTLWIVEDINQMSNDFRALMETGTKECAAVREEMIQMVKNSLKENPSKAAIELSKDNNIYLLIATTFEDAKEQFNFAKGFELIYQDFLRRPKKYPQLKDSEKFIIANRFFRIIYSNFDKEGAQAIFDLYSFSYNLLINKYRTNSKELIGNFLDAAIEINEGDVDSLWYRFLLDIDAVFLKDLKAILPLIKPNNFRSFSIELEEIPEEYKKANLFYFMLKAIQAGYKMQIDKEGQPNYFGKILLLASMMVKDKKTKETAKEIFHNIVSLSGSGSPNDETTIAFLMYIGNRLLINQDYQDARAYYEEVLTIDDSNCEARWGITKCEIQAPTNYSVLFSKSSLNDINSFKTLIAVRAERHPEMVDIYLPFYQAIENIKDSKGSRKTKMVKAFKSREKFLLSELLPIDTPLDALVISIGNNSLIKSYELYSAKRALKDENEDSAYPSFVIKEAKRRRRNAGLITFLISCLLVGALSLNFFLFLPNNKNNNAAELIKSGNFDEALASLDSLSFLGNKETQNLKTMSNAGKAFDSNDYEAGIDYMIDNGGTVNIAYNTDGGEISNANQTLGPAKRMIKANTYQKNTLTPDKTGYSFLTWEVKEYTFDTDAFSVDLSLEAKYQVITYTVTYELNGGINHKDNPVTYTIEDNINLEAASKDGYTFLGWYDKSNSNKEILTRLGGEIHKNITLVASFNTGNEYTVNFNPNGGTLSSTHMVATYDANYTLPTPTRPGYTFDGWYIDNTEVPISGKWTYLNDIYVTAKYTPIVYNITYNLNGGTNNPDNPTTYTVESNITLKEPSKAFNDFLGWEYNGQRITSIDVSLMKDIVVEAIFEATTYHITYNLNNGELDSGYLTTYNYYTDTITLPTPTRGGYTFQGWYDNNTFTGAPISKIEQSSNGDKEFFAKWSANTYNIVYNLNGGNNDSENIATYTPEDSFLLRKPTRTGYTFLGWYNDSNEHITVIGNGNYGDINLTANWNNGNEHTIVLEPNGGNIASASLKVNYDHSYAIEEPTRTGYTFDGWFNEDTLMASTGTWKLDEDVLLSARWTAIEYNITYTLNGGTNSGNNPAKYTIEDSTTFENPTKKGYTFINWKDANEQVITNIELGSIGDIALTAYFNDGNAYKANLNANGGTCSETSIDVQYDHSYTLPSPTRTGYTFTGWYNEDNLIAQSGVWTYDSDLNLEARWSIINYTISYNANGGSSNNNPATYNIESDTIGLQNLTKTGYTQLRWEDENGNAITQIPHGSTGNRVLTAVWNDGNEYTYTLDANGGTCASTSLNIQYNHSFTIPTPSRNGYTFAGWYRGSSVVPNSGDKWTYGTSNGTLTAHWTAITYTITYTYDSGLTNNNPTSYTADTATITLNPLSKPGYRFDGWYKGSSKVTTIPKGSTGNISLEARFTAESYTATFKPNGGQFSDNASTDNRVVNVTYDQSYSIPAVERLGYDFLGWKDENQAAISNSVVWNYTSNKVFTANWQLHTYTITYTNLGNATHSNPSTYNVTSSIELGNASLIGYTFQGWYDDGDNLVTSINPGTTGNISLEARFTHDQYVITLSPNGGTISPDTVNVYYDSAYNLGTPSRPGYTFQGWYLDNNLIPTSGDHWTYSTSSITLTARWSLNTYHVYYTLNGCTNSSSNPTTVTYEDNITLVKPTYSTTGYYTYWKNTYGTKITTLYHVTADVYLSAYKSNVYTLHFDCEGADYGTYTVTYGSYPPNISGDGLPFFQGWWINGVNKWYDSSKAWTYTDDTGEFTISAVIGH